MFFHKDTPPHTKIILLMVALIGGISLTIPADSSIGLSASIISPEKIVSKEAAGSVFEIYTKRIGTIQKATQTLTSELSRLHESREGLQKSIELKQHLLAATLSQSTEKTEIESTTTVIKNLTQEINTLQKQIQDYETKINDIYSQISTYGQEMDDLSSMVQ